MTERHGYRFRECLKNLQDCWDWWDHDDCPEEILAREELYDLCKQIIDELV